MWRKNFRKFSYLPPLVTASSKVGHRVPLHGLAARAPPTPTRERAWSRHVRVDRSARVCSRDRRVRRVARASPGRSPFPRARSLLVADASYNPVARPPTTPPTRRSTRRGCVPIPTTTPSVSSACPGCTGSTTSRSTRAGRPDWQREVQAELCRLETVRFGEDVSWRTARASSPNPVATSSSATTFTSARTSSSTAPSLFATEWR